MAVAHVGQANAVNTATTISVTKSVTSGNLLVLSLFRAASGTVSSVSDGVNTWTSRVSTSNTGNSTQMWTAIAATTASITVTVTVSVSQGMRLQIEEASGSDTSSPVTATGSDTTNSNVTTKNCAAGGIDVAVGGMFFGVIANSAAPGVITYGSMTNNGSTGNANWVYHAAPSGLTAETGTITTANSTAFCGCGIAVQPPVAATGNNQTLLLMGV